MKILYVVTGLGQGGAERVVCDLADQMYIKGHQVKIVYLIGEALTLPFHKEIEIIKIHLNSIFSIVKSYILLSNLIKLYRPDVVHSHMIHANLLTRLVRVLTPIKKLICTAHSNNEGGRIRMLAYRLTHSLADLNTNVSLRAVQEFEDRGAIPVNGMRCIYNGINLSKYVFNPEARSLLINELNLDKDIFLILAVGRLNEQKDYLNLLEAISILKKENIRKFKLIIAGEGEMRGRIELFIQKSNLIDSVILLGQRLDIVNLMSAADLFVISSKEEGFGLVVAEAMACKCPVVATNAGGVSEVAGGYADIVDSRNSLKLAYALKNILLRPKSHLSESVELGYKHVHKNFDLNSISNIWERVYSGV